MPNPPIPDWIKNRQVDTDSQDGEPNEFEREEARLKTAKAEARERALAPHKWQPGQSGNPGGLATTAMLRREMVNSEDPQRVKAILDMFFERASDPGETTKQRISAGTAYLSVMGLMKGAEEDDTVRIRKAVDDVVREMLAEARAAVDRENREGAIDVESAPPGDGPDSSGGPG